MADTIPSLAATTADYQTVLTRTVVPGGGWQLVLGADPRRWFVRFQEGPTAGGVLYVLPGKPATGTDAVGTGNLPRDDKFRDAPSIVTGEWYALGNGTAVLMIEECVYLR